MADALGSSLLGNDALAEYSESREFEDATNEGGVLALSDERAMEREKVRSDETAARAVGTASLSEEGRMSPDPFEDVDDARAEDGGPVRRKVVVSAGSSPQDSDGFEQNGDDIVGAAILSGKYYGEDDNGAAQESGYLGGREKQTARRKFLKDLRVEHKYEQAACYVTDARAGRSIKHKIDPFSMKVYRFYNRRSVQGFFGTCVLALLSLAFFERPTSMSDLGGERVSAFLELCLMHVFLLEILLKLRFTGLFAFSRDYWSLAELAAICLILVDATVTIIFAPHLRVFRVFRPFFLVQRTRLLRSSIHNIVKSMPEITNVLILIGVAIFFFGVFAVSFFMEHITEDTYFHDLLSSFVSLFVLMTTANYPDVMMPEYRSSHWTIFFFFFYLVITLYFLLNFVLAVIYNRYRQHLQSHVKKQFDRQRLGLCAAFQLLDDEMNGEIDYTAFRNLFNFLEQDYEEDILRVIFNSLDSTRSGTLELNEFYGVGDVLGLDVRRQKRRKNLFELFIPCIYNYPVVQRFRRFVQSSFFDIMIDILIAINGIFIIVELHFAVEEREWDESEKTFDRMATYYDWKRFFDFESWIFTLIFVFEIFAKVFACGFSKFWKDRWNRFDLIVVIASVFGKVVYLVPIEWLDEEVFSHLGIFKSVTFVFDGSNLPFLLRLLRLLRVLSAFQRFKVIIQTLFELLPAFINFCALEVAVFYIFAIFGMELFKFKPQDARDAGVHQMLNSDYDALGYYDNNFDNFQNSMVTLFELMVVNNWHVIMNGYVAATSEWARVFFIIFYIWAVVIVLNLVIAFILEAFLMQWDKNKARDRVGEGKTQAMERKIRFAQNEFSPQSARGVMGLSVRKKNLRVEQVLHEMFTEDLVEVDDEDIQDRASAAINLRDFRSRQLSAKEEPPTEGPDADVWL